jgi:hypothetical protein
MGRQPCASMAPLAILGNSHQDLIFMRWDISEGGRRVKWAPTSMGAPSTSKPPLRPPWPLELNQKRRRACLAFCSPLSWPGLETPLVIPAQSCGINMHTGHAVQQCILAD